MKRKNKHCMERKKKGCSGSNRMILIHSNVSNRMILLHLYWFANRPSLDESSSIMNEKVFLQKVEVTISIGRLFPLTTTEGQSR